MDIDVDQIVFDTEIALGDVKDHDSPQTAIRRSGSIKGNFIVLEGKKSELCSIWQIRRNFSVMMILLTGSSFIFFLINFELKNLQGSLVANTISSQLAEIIANVCSGFLMTKVGPRNSFLLLYSLSLAGTLSLVFFDNPNFTVYQVAVQKFGISGTFNMCYMSALYLLPTILVSGAFGFCNALAHFVTILAPLIAEFDMPLPLYINIVCVTIAALTSRLLITNLPKFI